MPKSVGKKQSKELFPQWKSTRLSSHRNSWLLVRSIPPSLLVSNNSHHCLPLNAIFQYLAYGYQIESTLTKTLVKTKPRASQKHIKTAANESFYNINVPSANTRERLGPLLLRSSTQSAIKPRLAEKDCLRPPVGNSDTLPAGRNQKRTKGKAPLSPLSKKFTSCLFCSNFLLPNFRKRKMSV
ncbi:sphingosine N-acyltransferase LAG1 [Striga asiatica]|uniref:Sphingosine N-acyltransferase LAG1 n=1 Tax=Striga asiatica TaxID=4170 RepID=A0A5A7PT88_STRAF|nr:sphingosine N-acyltransferase LAG1 [Striga asiatica]